MGSLFKCSVPFCYKNGYNNTSCDDFFQSLEGWYFGKISREAAVEKLRGDQQVNSKKNILVDTDQNVYIHVHVSCTDL